MFIHDMFQLIPSIEVARNGNTGGSVLPGSNVEVKYITVDIKLNTNMEYCTCYLLLEHKDRSKSENHCRKS